MQLAAAGIHKTAAALFTDKKSGKEWASDTDGRDNRAGDGGRMAR